MQDAPAADLSSIDAHSMQYMMQSQASKDDGSDAKSQTDLSSTPTIQPQSDELEKAVRLFELHICSTLLRDRHGLV